MKRSLPNLRYYPGSLYLERLRKNLKRLSRKSPGRDFHPGPSEFEAGVPATQSTFGFATCSCLVGVQLL